MVIFLYFQSDHILLNSLDKDKTIVTSSDQELLVEVQMSCSDAVISQIVFLDA